MSSLESLHPDGREFDPFLFANVGDDKAGAPVTVVSALARLGLDPWKEAAELALLGRESARTRLATHLSRFNDVPTLRLDSGAMAEKLTGLLPDRVSHRVSKLSGSVTYDVPRVPTGWILLIVGVALVVARIYFLAQSG